MMNTVLKTCFRHRKRTVFLFGDGIIVAYFVNNAVKNAVKSMHFAEIEMFEKNLVDNSEKSVIMIITIKTSMTNVML